MTLQRQFEQKLQQLGSGGATCLSATDAPHQITCDVVERDALAVSFQRLVLASDRLAGADVARLKQVSDVLATRLTYLMEPISPIEIDAQGCVVQMRSNPPQRDDDGRAYYELLVRRGGQIALVRYRQAGGSSRQPVPATVTREVLVRLAGDFCAALD